MISTLLPYTPILPAYVAQLDACPTGDQEVAGLTVAGSANSFVEIDCKIFSVVILSFPLIQERQLSVSWKRISAILVKSLEDYACHGNVVRLTYHA